VPEAFAALIELAVQHGLSHPEPGTLCRCKGHARLRRGLGGGHTG
jgi:hypothetical protein